MPQEGPNPSLRVVPSTYQAVDALREAGATSFNGVLTAMLLEFAPNLLDLTQHHGTPDEIRAAAVDAWSQFMARYSRRLIDSLKPRKGGPK